MTLKQAGTLVAAALVAASAAGAQQRTGGSGIRVVKDGGTSPAVSTTTTTTTTTVVSPGDVALTTSFTTAPYANMSEKNMTAHMAGGDSLEIQISQLAQSKAMDPRVRDYASMLVNDHTAHLARTIDVIEDTGVEALVNDPERARMREVLRQLQNQGGGTDWDAAFLRFQVQHHNNELALWTPTVIQNARDNELLSLISATQASLTKHRDAAVILASDLGLSLR